MCPPARELNFRLRRSGRAENREYIGIFMAAADKTTSHDPWVEKYRPSSISDVCGQRDIVSLFEKTLTRNQVMHFLFYGSPGTGKTSMILSFCRDIYDEHQWRSHVLEINASYDRGIDMVRDKIKAFCKKSMTPFVRNNRRIHYKFVILDEADTLTNDAQNSLRRCIEIYSYNTRFCFLCNYPSKIIAPILSRCCVCHFQPIARPDALGQMKWICAQERLLCDDEAVLDMIYVHSRGDLRTCVSSLQALHYMYGQASAESFADYVRQFPTDIWRALHLAPVSDIPLIARTLCRNAYPVRDVLCSLIEWVFATYPNCSCAAAYDLGIELSKMERQIQYCGDSHLFVLNALHRGWQFARAAHTCGASCPE